MKLCPSEADFRPVSGRVLHVSDYFLIGIEGCGYKDQIGLFPTHHDDNGWGGCSNNHGVYCGFFENLPSIVFTTLSIPLAGDRNLPYPEGRLHLSPLPSLLRSEGGNRPTRCSEPLRSKVGGPSKVFARLCGMGPPGK